MANNIIDHIENSLRQIKYGWKSSKNEVMVGLFTDHPCQGAVTFTTIGLSHHLLESNSGKQFHEELLFTMYDRYPYEPIADLLISISEKILSSHLPLLRGDTLRLSNPIIHRNCMTGLYATNPVVFNESITVYSGSVPSTVFVWLIPIHSTEIQFVQSHGWSRFEDKLEERNPELLDLNRSTIV